MWKHKLGQAGDDELVYHEEDEAFYVHVSRSRSDQLLLIASGIPTLCAYLLLIAHMWWPSKVGLRKVGDKYG